MISEMLVLKRVALIAGLVVVATAAFTVWYVYGTWPVPEGYAFPRHSMWGGPAALFEGTLEEVDGCIRTQGGTQQFTVVWPPGYSLTLDGNEPVVHGNFREVRMGQTVRMGGGYYETGDPPPTTLTVGNCQPPYFLSTGFEDG
jgi:hypothetical protein